MKKRGIYKTDSGLTTFAFPDKETEAKWNAYCREINANRKRKLNPTKEEYLIFVERLQAEKRVRDAAPEMFEILDEFIKYYETEFFELYAKDGYVRANWIVRVSAIIKKAKG